MCKVNRICQNRTPVNYRIIDRSGLFLHNGCGLAGKREGM